jgi:hypothetical protein
MTGINISLPKAGSAGSGPEQRILYLTPAYSFLPVTAAAGVLSPDE